MPVEVERACNRKTNQGRSGAGRKQVGSPHDPDYGDSSEEEQGRPDGTGVGSDLEVLVVHEVCKRTVRRVELQQPIRTYPRQRGRRPLVQCRRPFDGPVLIARRQSSQTNLVMQCSGRDEGGNQDA